MKILLIIAFFKTIYSITFLELFGMGDLLKDLGKAKPVTYFNGEKSMAYVLDPTIYNFLKQFRNRTEFCDYKCQTFYNFPCFIVFGCNIQIRNFFLLIIFPLVMLVMVGICCGRGLWTFSCWFRYLVVVSGISLFIWVVRRCVEGQKNREKIRKEKEKWDQQKNCVQEMKDDENIQE